jgi:hypothetical protein
MYEICGLELDVNIVLLRGAQQAQEMDRTRTQRFILDHMIKEQRNATEEARLKMLDLSERYRIVDSGLDLASLRLKQSEENTLSKEMAIATEKMRIEKFAGLNGDSLLRLIGDELPSNPFLESAVEEYLDASGDREVLKSSRAAIEQEVSAIRSLLKTKLEMAEHELSIAKAIRENKQDSLMDERKKTVVVTPRAVTTTVSWLLLTILNSVSSTLDSAVLKVSFHEFL